MSRLIIILLSITFGASVSAQEVDSLSHKQRLIDCINNDDYNCAIKELPLVSDWSLYTDDSARIDVSKALKLIGSADSLQINSVFLDSLSLYVANEAHAIGKKSYFQGNYAAATAYLETASKIKKQILGDTHPNYAVTLNLLGISFEMMGNYTKAEKYYLEALKIRKSVLGENHPDYAASLNNIGILYAIIGDYAKAEKYYLEALKIRKSMLGENHPDYAAFLNNIGNFYNTIGEYAKAEKYLKQALGIRKSVLGENHPDYAASLNNTGNFYNTIGEYAKAEEYFIQALSIIKSRFGENHPDYAASLNNIGNLYRTKRDYAKAEKYIYETLEIRKSIFGDNHPKYASVLNDLGVLYASMGNYTKAEKYYLEALKIRKSVLGENHPYYALSLNNLGALYDNIGNRAKAEEYFLLALEIRKLVYGENHSEYQASLYNLGMFYHKGSNYSSAEPYYIKAQRISTCRFLKSIDYMSERQRNSYWATMQKPFSKTYPRFSYAYYSQKPSISTFAYNNELFTKGLLLSSSESVKRSIIESGDTALINQWNELSTKKQQIMVLQEKKPQSKYLQQVQEEAEQLEKQVTASSAAFRQNRAQWEITWDSVRNHLADNQIAIEYFTAPLNEDSTMYCALLVRNNSEYPEMIPLFEGKEALSLINTTSSANTDITYSYADNGKTLSDLVWQKVLPRIQQGETIYFAPSGLLHQVAIEALPYDSVHTMGDMYNLVRLSSTREIVLNKQANTHTTATLYGGIQYNADMDELLAESEQYSSYNLLASRSIDNDTLDRGGVKYLPGTKREVEQINKMLNADNLKVQLFTATSANEESFKAISGTHQNILHIATHGFYWSDSTAQKKDFFSQRSLRMDDTPTKPTIDPLNRCGLLMAGANTALSGHSADLPEGVQDGILTAKEISLLDLRDANLVVLSACETGKGEITGEGVFGLQRAFKQAGAQTIIMSLWPVNDAATQLLMTEFYRNWITNNQSKREAFRNAQNTVRSQYEEPVYWAGFIMLD